MKNPRLLAFLGLILIALTGCSDIKHVALDVSADIDQAIMETLYSFPLPEGFALQTESAENPDYAITIKEQNWDTMKNDAESYRLLGRVWYAPVVDLWNPAADFTDIEQRNTVSIIPFNDIKLPQRALSHSGKYPGDPGYPWHRDTLIYKDPLLPNELLDWIDGLPTSIEEFHLVQISAVGDIMPGRGVDTLLLQTNGPAKIFGNVLESMLQADLLLGNLEGAVSSSGSKAVKSYTF
ncbi:MAG: hypothetical protein HN368_12095, partial [Spirochaetales bacterium]|nr:hypothetical protein [Spirochaetales bacterium]